MLKAKLLLLPAFAILSAVPALAAGPICVDPGISRFLFYILFVVGAIGVLISLYAWQHLKIKRKLMDTKRRVAIDYVQKARKLGFKDRNISGMLEQHGYLEFEVDEALTKAKKK